MLHLLRRLSTKPKPKPKLLPSHPPLPTPLTPHTLSTSLRLHPSSAATLFRRAASHPNYRHTALVYRTLLRISLARRHFSLADSLADEVLSGACPDPTFDLLNPIVVMFCERNHLFSAFDVLAFMRRVGRECAPGVATYATVLRAVVRKFDESSTRYVYLRSIGALVDQMRELGLKPDLTVGNLVVKAYSRCSLMDVAVKVFDEIRECGCRPDEETYGYLVEGFFKCGRIREGERFYLEMREKGFVPTARVYMAVVNGFSMTKRFEKGIEVLFEMLGNRKTPDLLTYRTLLEGLCREGRRKEAFELLEVLKRKRRAMNQNVYSYLLKGLQWLCQDPSRI